MTRKTRRFIFYIFVVLFIVIALAIILYAQGYSFDWQKKSLVITGAFYFKSSPKEADIYINNQYQGKTNKFIKRLLPQKYDVKISKPEYYDWQKNLTVKSKLVTEAQNILLIKKNPALNLVTNNNVKNLSFSTDNSKIIYLTNSVSSQLTLRLLNLTDNNDIQIYPPTPSEGIENTSSLPNLNNLLNIFWSPDDEKILLFFSNNHYYILNLKNPLAIIEIDNLVKTLSNYKIYSIENVSFHPQNSNKIYFYFQNNLYLFEINNANPQKSLVSSIISDVSAYTIYSNKILYINTEGKFYKVNLEISSFKKIFDIPVFKSEQSLKIISDEMLVIKDGLYFINPQAQILEKITENIEEVAFSFDNTKKMFWRSKDKIGVIWLEQEFEQPPRNKYETEIVIKSTKDINQAIWHSKINQHIIYVIGDEIQIIELDNRDKRNTTSIFSIKNPRIFFDKENEKLYILSNEKLFEISMKN